MTIQNIDHTIFFFFNKTIANPVFDELIKFFVEIPGQAAIVLLALACFLFGKKYLKFTALILLSSFTVSKYTYEAVKNTVKRPRPFHLLNDVNLLLGPHHGFSFPSGHSTISFSLATVIAMRYPKLSIPAFFAAVLVALSRLYVGAHYPSDIFAGAILGIFIGYVLTKTATKILQED